MKKKNWSLFIAALILFLIAGILIYNNTSSTLGGGNREFAFEDTASVDKIFLADRGGKTILLEKNTAGGWTANKRIAARTDAIQMLLSTIRNLRVKSPVSKAGRNTVIKDLAANGTKVEIYRKGKLARTYYVGRETPDNLGTYMLMENSSEAFIMDVPGFNGYLTPRFFTSETEWREQEVFRYAAGDISKLSFENKLNPLSSFEINLSSPEKFIIKGKNGRPMEDADPSVVFSYLSRFQRLNYESLSDMKKERRDSVFNSIPAFIIKVWNLKSEVSELKIFLKYTAPGEAISRDANGNNSPFDVNRMYAQKNGADELMLIQNFVFDKVLLSYEDFRKKGKK